MTRQERYQQKHKAAGLCIYCSRKAVSRWFCAMHLKKRRLSMRKLKGNKPWRPGGRGRPPLITSSQI